MNDGVEIVRLRPEEWRPYREIRLEALLTEPTAFGATYESQVQNSDEHWQDRLRVVGNGRQWLLFARKDGELLGMIGAFVADEPAVAKVIAVYVRERARGQGIGERLVSAILEAVCENPDVTTARLDVTGTNVKAIRLYERAGFEHIGASQQERCELVMERPVSR